MASLAALATKCRFAVLEVSDDDEDEEKSGVGDDEAGNSESADANNVTKTKKKRKKKKNKAKNEKVMTNGMEIFMLLIIEGYIMIKVMRAIAEYPNTC